MTIELRKTGDLEQPPDRVPVRQRVQGQWVRGRIVATAVVRRRGWSVWRSTTRAVTIAWRIVWQLPGVALLLVAYSPRGAARLVRAWARFVHDDATAELRAHHAGAKETGDYARASAHRSANLRARILPQIGGAGVVLAAVLAWTAPQGLGVLLGVVAAYVAVRVSKQNGWAELAASAALGYGVYLLVPWAAGYLPRPPEWVWWLLAAVAVAAAGWAGRPRAKPLVTMPEVTGGRVPPLTAPVVMAALVSLGNGQMKTPDDIKLLSDPVRSGQGYQVDLELPGSLPAAWVIQRREQFAAVLRRELGCVFLTVGRRHPGHLVIYVSDQPMSQQDQEPWPLLRAGKVDLFEPTPMVTDQRGDWVPLTFAYSSMVIGAVPRMGKTFLLRQALVACALDPRARIYALDGKATGDLAPLLPIAHFYSRGMKRIEEVGRVRAMVADLRKELGDRADFIDSLSEEECPENKVTSELASRYPAQLSPIVVGVDETQMYFDYGQKKNKEHAAIRDELSAGFEELVKLGPALGIIVFLATQNVNTTTIPRGISINVIIRAALMLFDHTANDQVLGTGAYAKGIDATQFDFEDKGVLYLAADGARAQIVRSAAGLDARAAKEVIVRARALRAAAGTLPPDEDEEVADVVLDEVADVELVMHRRDRPQAHLAELVDWLGELRPDYAALDVGGLGKVLRGRGVPTPQVRVAERVTVGVRTADLRKRLADDRLGDDNNGGE